MGLLAPFKNKDGSFHKWAYILFVIAILVIIRDLYALSAMPESNPVRDKEIEMIINEIKGVGNNIIETEGENYSLNNPDYEYQYEGARILHEFLISTQKSYEEMDSDFANIEERSLDEIEMNELNDPLVIEELRSSYQKQMEVMEKTYQKDSETMQLFTREISQLQKKYPDDHFISGLHKGYVESSDVFEDINEEIMTLLTDFTSDVDAYLKFLLDNQGQYEFDKDGAFIARTDEILEAYNKHVDSIQKSSNATNQASARYMEEMSSRFSDLNAALN